MEDTKKTVLAGNGEKDVPRAVYDGVLTIDVDAQVESMEEQEEARWHQLLNAHRTRKILTGQLGGIEKLESGWMVAVTYFNGFRIIIPMNEMMINLQGDGRENADTLNRQVRIANNMLGCDIDFIIKDLDNKSRSVVASRKDAMLKKRQTFYIGEDTEKPMLYEGRIVEARVIAVAPKAVRLEVFGVEVSVRARDMAWEWMVDAGEKFQVGDLVLVMVNKVEASSVDQMKKSISYIFILLSGICWGCIGLSNRMLTQMGMGLGNRVFVRNFGTLVVLTVMFGLLHREVFRIKLRHLPIFLGSGLVSILLLSIVYFQCQTLCSLSVAAILLYLAPSFVVLISAVLWKTPLTGRKLAALGISLVGCVLVSGVLGGGATASLPGIALGVASGLCYASYTVFAHYGMTHYSSYTMIYWHRRFPEHPVRAG